MNNVCMIIQDYRISKPESSMREKKTYHTFGYFASSENDYMTSYVAFYIK